MKGICKHVTVSRGNFDTGSEIRMKICVLAGYNAAKEEAVRCLFVYYA